MTTLLSRLLGTNVQFNQTPSTPGSNADGLRLHEDIARMAVSDVLRKYGIPPTWVTVRAQAVGAARRNRGIELHLMIREWHPELLPHMVALERHVRARTLRLDPFCPDWLVGISWSFDLVDASSCPEMPPPAFWNAGSVEPDLAAPQGAASLHARLERRTKGDDRKAWMEGDGSGAPGFLPTQPLDQPHA
jgi:hypothetical protein